MARTLKVPLENHPIAEIFPLLPEAELKELAEDIEKNGLQVPILIYQGKILDGRNRYRAMQLIPGYLEEGFLDQEKYREYLLERNPVDYVLSLNLKRRHLTPRQCVAAAVELANLKHGQRADRVDVSIETSTLGHPNIKGSIEPFIPVTREEAVKRFNVSLASFKRAAALKKASPKKFKEFKAGKISLNAALKAVKPDPVPEPSKSWTEPEVGEQGAEILKQLNQLDALHTEFFGVVKMIEAAQRSTRADLLKPDEFKVKLIRLRDLINNQIENLTYDENRN